MPTPKQSHATRENARLRQQRLRARRKESGYTEIRANLPNNLAADIELLTLFTPGAQKESMFAVAVESYLERHAADVRKVALLIERYWFQINDYREHTKGALRPGQMMRIKDRIYRGEEAVKLGQIERDIKAFLVARGHASPETAIGVIFQRMRARK